MIGWILGGLGAIGLFNIGNAMQAKAAADLYEAVKKYPPPTPPPKPPPANFIEALYDFMQGGRG